MNSAEALERLRDGNGRYVAGNSTLASTADQAARAELVGGQSPYAIVLACSDSRVPVELVFDEGPGQLFIIRVAGNVATPTQIGSIEYAVSQLGAQLVLVLGHSSCGAVAAALDSLAGAAMPSPNLEAIVNEIRPAIEPLGDADLDQAVAANVQQSADQLLRNSAILAKAVKDGVLTVAKATYSLETGAVEFLDT